MSVSSHHQGKPDDEMFMNQPNTESPTLVEPLRITKRNSGASITSQQAMAGSAAPQPAYPMPSLPYPDGRSRKQSQGGAAGANGAAAYPYPDVRRVQSPGERAGSAGSADYQRRAGSA
ncbi:MAG: hypothetical protein M1823_008600, partial [Watsoniomyces obsoletus]